jgi:S-adenosylmethionine-diacylglycerol 3-amino-3-carboxypropyl transferase
MSDRFFRSINYSSVNEDWRTELAGLKLSPGSRVLCVTGSGDRPLDLLAAAAVDVVAIDLSEAQNALLQLKAVAIRDLPFDEYSRFIGLHEAEASWRESVLRRLMPGLASGVSEFWMARLRHVRRGVIYCGRFERYMRRVSRVGRFLRPRAIPTLFSFTSLEKQRQFLTESWDRPYWRAVYRLILSPIVTRLVFRDPAYFEHTAVPVGTTVYDRMIRGLTRYLARDSFMVSLALRGRLSDHDLPPYLTPNGCAAIRDRLHLLSVVTADIVEYLELAPRRSFTHFSLSDVPSFLTESGFRRLLSGVIRCAKPNARVVLRQFLTRYELPEELSDGIVREPEVEALLSAEDRSFAYEFLVGTVHHDHR